MLPDPAVPSGISANGMGFIKCLEVDYSDSSLNTFYAGGASGGLWKTTNGGTTWSCLTDNTSIPAIGIADIAIDPNNNNIIYAATAMHRFHTRNYGIGLIKTTDGGATWSSVSGLSYQFGSKNFVHKIVTHPSNSLILHAFVHNRLHRSTDGGINWTVVYTLPVTTNHNPGGTTYRKKFWRDLIYHPTDTNIMYASTDDHRRDDGGAMLLKSVNGGASWVDITYHISQIVPGDTTIYERIDLAVSPQFPDKLYLSGSYNYYSAIHISSNKGQVGSWSYEGRTNTNLGKSSMQEFQVSPVDEDVMYLGGIFFSRMNDGNVSNFARLGTRVGNQSNWLHDDTRDFVIVRADSNFNNNRLLLGTDGGVFETTDGGATFNNISNNMSLTDFWDFDVATDNSYLVGGMQDQGSIYYDFNADTWTNGGYWDGGAVMVSKTNPAEAYGIGWNPVGRFIKLNSGFGWSYIEYDSSDLTPNSLDFHHPARLHFNQNKMGEKFISASSVYKKDSVNSLWNQLGTFPNSGLELKATAISNSNSSVMYAARNEALWCGSCSSSNFTGKVFRSSDAGQSWTDISAGIDALQYAGVSDIVISPDDEDRLWITHQNTYGNHKVTYSNDGGNSWSNYSSGLPNVPITSIVYQEGSDDRLFIGTDVGVYYRDNSMSSWECYSTNLPIAIVSKLIINPCTGTMYASTFGRSIWFTGLPEIEITSNISWNEDLEISSPITVKNSSILTINGNIKMGKNAKIIVEPGSSLLLYGTLEANDCNELWPGIELSGDASKNQTYANQPYLFLNSGSKISDAKVAIRAGATDSTGSFISGSSGGFYYGTATFRNNLTDIKMHPYQNLNPFDPGEEWANNSKCIDCIFISDQDLPNNEITDVHVDLDGVFGVEFDGSKFQNDLAQSTMSDRGIGIQANESSFRIEYNNSQTPEFENLYKGVKAIALNSLNPVYVQDAVFKENVIGIELTNNDFSEINKNSFTVLHASNYDSYGIYFNSCSDFMVEENSFESLGSNGQKVVGIVVNASGDHEKLVYKNSFQDFDAGVVVHGDNRFNSTEGLKIKCNDFDANGIHISAESTPGWFGTDPDLPDQGASGSQDAPAGNLFNDLCTGPAQTDFYYSSAGTAINYYHHANTITIPDCKSNGVTNLTGNNDPFSQSEACPSSFKGGGGGPWGEEISLSGGLEALLSQKRQLSTDRSIQNFVRAILRSDTISWDTVAFAFANSRHLYRQKQMINAMKMKNSNFKGGSIKRLLHPEASDFMTFLAESSTGEGKVYQEALNNVKSHNFIEARIVENRKNGAEIPYPIVLPSPTRELLNENTSFEVNVKIYPNPTSEESINVVVQGEDGTYSSQILDHQGKVVRRIPSLIQNKINKVSLGDLPTGIYYFSVYCNEKKIESHAFEVIK